MNHYEMTSNGARKCRTEYFTPFHDELRQLLRHGAMNDVAGILLGEPAVLYKEKINYKLAGGAGWEPHQDAPAYPYIDSHISCMIAVDEATTENGCLEVVSGLHHELIATDERGCIPNDVAIALEWQPVPIEAGTRCGSTLARPIAVATTIRLATVARSIPPTTLSAKAICGRPITPRSEPSSQRPAKMTAYESR